MPQHPQGARDIRMQSESNRIRYIKEKKKQLQILDMFHQFGEGFVPCFPTSSLYFISCCPLLFRFHRNTKIVQHVQRPWPNLHLHLLQLPTCKPNGHDSPKRFGGFKTPKKRDTPRKSNMSPENHWLEDVFPIEIVPFQATC